MPVDEHLHTNGDPLDLENETYFKTGTAQGEPLYVGGIRQDSSGSAGAGADAANYNAGFLGTDANVAPPTAVTIATGAGAAGTISVTFTLPAGASAEEVLVYLNSTGEFVKKLDMTATNTPALTGLTPATSYDVRLRTIMSDGRLGRFTNKTTVTSHA
jgi:hypothetical protein